MRLYLKPHKLNWHPHFLLTPRFLDDANSFVWLETIERRYIPPKTYEDSGHYEYRSKLAVPAVTNFPLE